MGPLSDAELAKAYKEADLLLVPSQTTETSFEGFGLVYIEANAYGVPCIGPERSGAAEAIEDGKSGYTVSAHDPALIAKRMHWILNEEKISAASCRAWAEAHSIEKTVNAVEEVYSLLHSSS